MSIKMESFQRSISAFSLHSKKLLSSLISFKKYRKIDFQRECSVQNVGFRSQTAYRDGTFVCLYSNAFSFAFLNLYLRSERMMIIGRGLKKMKKD